MGFSKIRKKSQKIHMYSDKLSNQFCLKKSHFTSFYWTIFFYQFINKFLDFLISKINVISIFRKVDFFKTFVSSGSIFFIHGSTCTAIAFNISPSPFPFSSFLLVSLSFTFFPPETPPFRMWPQPFFPNAVSNSHEGTGKLRKTCADTVDHLTESVPGLQPLKKWLA